jgi:hypothetical protein
VWAQVPNEDRRRKNGGATHATKRGRVSAQAEEAGTPPGPDGGLYADQGGYVFTFLGADGGLDGKVVSDAPYSGTLTTELVQQLPDGKQLVRIARARVYRDGLGRTRYEQIRSPDGSPGGTETVLAVVISDPAARISYVLDTKRRIARELPLIPVDGELPGSVEPSPPPLPRESLGQQTIDGVEALGERTLLTIPTGELGNDAAIETVAERWYSDELQTVVLATRRDPRFGETRHRLTEVVRGEPDPGLFKVPSGYRIRSAPPIGIAKP